MTAVVDNPQGWDIGLKIGPRPRLKTLGFLDATMVITLQRPEEGAQGVGIKCDEFGIEWVNKPLDSRDSVLQSPAGREEFKRVKEVADFVDAKIKEKHRIYLHCAAGIHRTGMVTYAWLLHLGFDHSTALGLLGWFRPAIIADESVHPKLNLLRKFLTKEEPSWMNLPASSDAGRTLGQLARTAN